MASESTKIARKSDGDKEERNQKSVAHGVKGPLDQRLEFRTRKHITEQVGACDSGHAAQPFCAHGIERTNASTQLVTASLASSLRNRRIKGSIQRCAAP